MNVFLDTKEKVLCFVSVLNSNLAQTNSLCSDCEDKECAIPINSTLDVLSYDDLCYSCDPQRIRCLRIDHMTVL